MLTQEPPRVLERYTPKVDPDAFRFYTSEDALSARKLLLARRLIEAGVRCVSVSFSDFAWHPGFAFVAPLAHGKDGEPLARLFTAVAAAARSGSSARRNSRVPGPSPSLRSSRTITWAGRSPP